jgi:hypothetical protein
MLRLLLRHQKGKRLISKLCQGRRERTRRGPVCFTSAQCLFGIKLRILFKVPCVNGYIKVIK